MLVKFMSTNDHIWKDKFIPNVVIGLSPAYAKPWPQSECFKNLFVLQNYEIEERISLALNNNKNVKYRKYEDFRKSLQFQRTISSNVSNYSNHISLESEGKCPISQASREN